MDPGPAGGLVGLDDAISSPSPGSARLTSRPAGPPPPPGAHRATRCRPTRTGPADRCTSIERERPVDAEPATLWRVIEGIGGERGWYSFPLAWSVRGWLDRAVGGVGLRRGRRDPDRLFVGESLDCWRVEERIPGRLLRLRAEMRVPGLAWLELEVREDPTRYHQRARLPSARPAGPRSTGGRVAPFHGFVFGGMARNIARAAEQLEGVRPWR